MDDKTRDVLDLLRTERLSGLEYRLSLAALTTGATDAKSLASEVGVNPTDGGFRRALAALSRKAWWPPSTGPSRRRSAPVTPTSPSATSRATPTASKPDSGKPEPGKPAGRPSLVLTSEDSPTPRPVAPRTTRRRPTKPAIAPDSQAAGSAPDGSTPTKSKPLSAWLVELVTTDADRRTLQTLFRVAGPQAQAFAGEIQATLNGAGGRTPLSVTEVLAAIRELLRKHKAPHFGLLKSYLKNGRSRGATAIQRAPGSAGASSLDGPMYE